LEYPIPGTPFWRPDILNVVTGDIYEIKPVFPWSIARGALQVARYETALLRASRYGWLSGSYVGIPFNWNTVPFHVGTSLGWPVRYRSLFPPAPAFDLVADYVGRGVVAYWLEPNSLFYSLVASGVTIWVTNKRLVRPPGWSPVPVTAPAYAINNNFALACGVVLVVAGGSILIYTVVNDLTGVGIADDVVTVPGGLYLLNAGLQAAMFVPVVEFPISEDN
jgi:hypothetical protein